MTDRARSVLYVRLPCWKIYPGGVIYVADYIHKQRPDMKQEILDLALVPSAQRRQTLKQTIQRLRPDVVAFSWRNMQSFGPHPEDDALDVVMNFDHSPNLWRRIKAAFSAFSIIFDYTYSRIRNFAFMNMTRKLLPDAKIVVGGTAVSIFGKYVAEKCPANSTIVIGEGEPAMLSIVDGDDSTIGECYYKEANGHVHFHDRQENFDLSSLTAVDFRYIESIFPAFNEYLGDYVGVHTKRGCPYQCHFCLYNKIEGHNQRYREPVEIVNEIESLNTHYGVNKIWFTDAQFCSTRRSTQHVELILDEIIRRQLKIKWTGYIRLNYLTPALAKKMLDSGLASLDLSFTGTQEMINSLTLGYSLEQQMQAFQMFKDAGYTSQKVKLYMPLNAPGETVDTLLKTIDCIKDLYNMFGRDNVLPFIFFIGIQPGTPVEKLLIEQGYLDRNYNPLTLNPFTIKKLLYNPDPLGSIIARSYLEAVDSLDSNSEYIGRATMDNLERMLSEKNMTGITHRSFPYFGKLQKYVTQQHCVIEDRNKDKF
ncbi:MAG: radical SAM protein [Gammaproteobacteria bacterium]|nr:radical SAM protein [Gammaproteobacteria bacterium]MDH5735907.1 radical SAM protein [Gammaproteobacteria bacterium]